MLGLICVMTTKYSKKFVKISLNFEKTIAKKKKIYYYICVYFYSVADS